MRKAKDAKNLNNVNVKVIEAEVEKHRKKREERIKLSKIQTDTTGSGLCWNTVYYDSLNN